MVDKEFENFDLFYDKENIDFRTHDIELIYNYIITDLMKLSEIKIIEPLLKNPRMRIQDGIFTLTPLWKSDIKTGNCKSFREMLTEMKKPLLEFIIHKDYKKEILIELEEKFGISEKTLFINSKTIQEEEEKLMNLINDDIKYVEKLISDKKKQ
jgi:hypothetical protein